MLRMEKRKLSIEPFKKALDSLSRVLQEEKTDIVRDAN
jgi:hypothetical protein